MSAIDFDKIDFTVGSETMKEFYTERTIESKSWEDFLKIPKSKEYMENSKRVANDFKVEDKMEDIVYKHIRDIKLTKPVITDKDGNVVTEF
jgi:hypothetical protein